MAKHWKASAGLVLCTAALGWAVPEAQEPKLQPYADQFADIDDSVRFVPSTQPQKPEPQKPPLSTEKNVDTQREPNAWQRLTDDWGGLRPKLDDKGISLNGGFYGDLFKNLRGGLNTEDLDFMHLSSINLTVDTERLFGHKGGTFFIDLQHIGGDNPSDNVGDWQWVSSLASDRRDQIAELWYEQKLMDDALRIKLGKIDAGSEFDVSDVGGEFLNASGGMSPTLPGFVTYPDPAFGVVVEYLPCEHGYIRAGLFDGNGQEGKSLGDDGARTLFTGPGDLLLIGEIGTDWTLGHLPGRAALGMTYHTGTFDRFEGGTDSGIPGVYLVVEHMLAKEAPDNDEDLQGTSLYLRAGATDGDTQEVCYHVGCGVVSTGLVTGRDDDSIGLAMNYINFSDEASFTSDELNFELFYKLQVTHYLSLKPDVQYIVNPNGDESLDDALAIGMRFSLEF